MQQVNINTPFYWDIRYALRNYPSAHPNFLGRLWFVYGLCKGSVLDVGCGEGFLVNMLAMSGHKATGVDHSKVGLSHARKGDVNFVGFLFERVGEFYEAEAHSLPFEDGSFDTVVASELLEHVDDLLGVISELKRVCRCGGRVIVSVPQVGTPPGPEHIREVSLEDLQAYFKEFEDLTCLKVTPALIFWGRKVK